MLHDLIQSALLFIEGLGVWGILLGLMLEVIPSEIVLAYGGYLVSRGEVSMIGAIVFGTIGCMFQQVILYWIGRYGGRPALNKFGKFLHIKSKHFDIAEGWFNKYGPGMVFLARFVPVLRQAISIPAGMARMPMWKFLFYTLLGTIPWAILFVYLGRALGDNWEQIDEVAAPYTKPVLIAVAVITVLYVLWKVLTRKKSGGPKDHRADTNNGYGVEGEKSTAHQLKYIGAEYRVLHGRRVHAGGGTQEFDHIVVGPNGVFHIDSKHWSGDIHFTGQGVERVKSRSDRGKQAEPHSQDPTAQLYRHEYVLKELFKQHRIQADLVGIVCFTHPNCRLVGTSPAFATLKLDRLVHHIKTYKPKRTLSAAEVASIEKLIKDNSK